MATSSFVLTITAPGATQEEADALRNSGLVRFVRTNARALELDPATVADLPFPDLIAAGTQAIGRYIAECMVADVANEADASKQAAVEAGRQAAAALRVGVTIP